MYTVFKMLGWKKALADEALPVIAALLVAEVFFRWHSFLLEAAGFLGVWMVFSYLFFSVRRVATGK